MSEPVSVTVNNGLKRQKISHDNQQDQSSQQSLKIDERSRKCPYLDTINRNLLDFDFEKLCSISLSKINVYACLICGKYFQGRGIKTHAYTHSVSCDHHVFLNLETLKFYCLPDNYEIIDSSLSKFYFSFKFKILTKKLNSLFYLHLDDIIYVLKPAFTSEEIKQLVASSKLCRAFDGTTYLTGIVGLNNIKANDYCNVVFQALSHVSKLRNYFLIEKNFNRLMQKNSSLSILPQRFGELLRKLWNPRLFKAHVSPHEMLQAIVLCSKKRFIITQQNDPIDFLSWFLNTLHQSLRVSKTDNRSIINDCFQGSMKVYSRKVLPIDKTYDEKLQLMLKDEYKEKCEETNFLYLTLDLPPTPLFIDENQESIIPQVALYAILNKFNGIQEKEYSTYKDSQLKRFKLTKLPKYLILYIKRFTKNTFFLEKNPTIVNFELKDLNLSEYLEDDIKDKHPTPVYDLVANIIHEGSAKESKGIYKLHILHESSSKWFEIQDLHVTEVLPQMITLAESYIQLWKRKD